MTNWRTYRQEKTGNTIVEVSNGTQILIVTLTPHKRKTMPLREFQRLVKRLGEALELYDEA